MPHPISPSEALAKYWEMMTDLNPEPFIQHALKEGWATSEKSARESLVGAMQWLAYHSTSKIDAPSIMMGGPVSRMCESLRANREPFRDFCLTKIRYLVHFFPVDDDTMVDIEEAGGVDYTLAALHQAFGEDLCHALRDWEIERNDNALQARLIVLPGEAVTADSEVPDTFGHFWADSPLLNVTSCHV